mgnify:FL=1
MADFLPHLYGQEKVKKEWKRLLEENRLPHTLILYGDEGLGKTTAALDLAGELTGKSDKVWNAVASWEEGAAKKEPVLTMADDQVWYLRPLGLELKIEQFRIFLDAMASFDEKPHVCIIDEAQTMMDPVANSLLKTLEEPEGNIHFILITHDLHALLPTIISRGERFAFFPLGEADYMALMASDPKKYKFPADMDAKTLYQLSEGNPGITLEVCDETGDSQPEEAMHFWETMTFDAMPFSKLSKEWKDRDEFLRMLRWMILVGRDIMVLAETGNSSLARCISVVRREQTLAGHWKDGRSEEALTVLKTAETAVSRYINMKNIWDMILIQLEHIRKGSQKWSKL